MRQKQYKHRIHWPNPWLTRKPLVSVWHFELSNEFRKFAEESNFGPYRFQSHKTFVTVIFEQEKDAMWIRMLT